MHGEQGFGDTIQFLRYIPLLQRIGAHVRLEVQRELVELVRSSLDVEVIARGDPIPFADYRVPVFCLPLIFATAG